MKTALSLLFTIFALLGVLDAGYIGYGEITGQIPPCRPPFACREVLESSWSHIGPVPLFALGGVHYVVLLILGGLLVTEHVTLTVKKRVFYIPLITLILGTVGLFFSWWLIFIMGVVLHAWCLYCILSAINCHILFILSVAIYRSHHSVKEAYALHV